MNLKGKTSLLVIFLALFLADPVSAQLHTGGLPKSFSQAVSPDESNLMLIEAPSLDAVLAEDMENPVPYRFAINIPVDFGIDDFQNRFIVNGSTEVRRLTIQAIGAQGLTLYFDQFRMPEGARLFVYNSNRTQLLGAFTAMNNNRFSTFATSLIRGDKLTLEYDAPAGSAEPLLHVSEIAYAYRGNVDTDGINTGFGASGPCEVNVNCQEGTAWQKQKRGVTRIQIKRGTSTVFCTGSVVDNVMHDGKPYILTADHCGRLSSELDLTKWIFYFNYEASACPEPTKEPGLHSITGAAKIASGGESGTNGSDFFLVLLQSSIPDSFNVHYNGWSRETTPSQIGVSIHHPQGDIKKVSTYKVPLQPAYWSGDSKLAHWKVQWSQTPNGHGTTEFGSSGSPLFNEHGQIVGTLTGGDSSCDSSALNLPDYYGMFSYHWDKNGLDSAQQLKPWLDPKNTNVMSLDGWAMSVQNGFSAEKFEIFPNPVRNQFTIKGFSNLADNIRIELFNLPGNRVSAEMVEKFISNDEITVHIPNLAPGLYLIRIQDGDKTLVRRFVKMAGE